MTLPPSRCRFPQHDLRSVSAAPQGPQVGLGEGGAWTNPVGRRSSGTGPARRCVWTIQPQGLLGADLTHRHGGSAVECAGRWRQGALALTRISALARA